MPCRGRWKYFAATRQVASSNMADDRDAGGRGGEGRGGGNLPSARLLTYVRQGRTRYTVHRHIVLTALRTKTGARVGWGVASGGEATNFTINSARSALRNTPRSNMQTFA